MAKRNEIKYVVNYITKINNNNNSNNKSNRTYLA